jgi:preprotein translocase subunit SecE
MSEKKEKTTAEVAKKDKKEAPAKKKSVDFKAIGEKVKKFFKDFKGEWKKVTWPSGKTVLNHSLVVIVVVLVFGLIIFGFDTGLSAIIDGLVSLANKQDVAETTTQTAQMLSLFFIK